MADLKYTLDQARTRVLAHLGLTGIPNPWWGLSYSNDCLAMITEALGLRTGKQYDAQFTSISHFVDWIRQDSDWEIIPASQARPGDILFENWDSPRTHTREHAEWLYSIDRAAGTCVIVSANTGPLPGIDIDEHPELRGKYKKKRALTGDWLVDAARPPYRNPATVTTSKARAEARLTATWLNQQPELRAAGVPQTATGDIKQADGTVKPGDGLKGPIYYLNVQTWGDIHGKYQSPPLLKDGIRGDHTDKVDVIVTAKAKAAKR